MKKIILVSLFVLGLTSITNGQSISKSDSLEVMKAMNKVFKNFKMPVYTRFEKIATKEIYCILCEDTKGSQLGPYIINRKDFFEQYLSFIQNSESWKRATASDQILLVQENTERSDITVFITTWKEDEYAQGHEGAQMGLHFKKVNGKYRFSGIETIP